MGLTNKNVKNAKDELKNMKDFVEKLILSGDILDNGLDHIMENHYDVDIRVLEERKRDLPKQSASAFDYGINIRSIVTDTLLSDIWNIALLAMDEDDEDSIIIQKTYKARIGYGIFKDFQDKMDTVVSECHTCTVVLGQKMVNGKNKIFVKTTYTSIEEALPPLTFDEIFQ